MPSPKTFGNNIPPSNRSSFDPSNPPLAEDSEGSSTWNKLFYGNLRGMEPEPARQPAHAVSIDELRHPLSRKGADMLRRADNFSAMGLHDRAIAQLQKALQERSAIPYAHSMLGIEYLLTKQVLAAIPELEQGVAAMPHNVPNHSNLAYALMLTGNLDRSEQEARRALELDPRNEKTKHVLGQILDARKRQGLTEP